MVTFLQLNRKALKTETRFMAVIQSGHLKNPTN